MQTSPDKVRICWTTVSEYYYGYLGEARGNSWNIQFVYRHTRSHHVSGQYVKLADRIEVLLYF